MEGFDLGLSTLGTGDEAAGSPNTAEQVAMARALGKCGAPKPPTEQSARVSKPGRLTPWIIVAVWPSNRTSSATRQVRRASGAAMASRRSVKVCRSQAGLRHRQRPSRRFSVNRPLRGAATAYVQIVQGTPLLILLFLIYFGLAIVAQ